MSAIYTVRCEGRVYEYYELAAESEEDAMKRALNDGIMVHGESWDVWPVNARKEET